ncbi:hypothetical protein ZHAS_00000614 [Anopheles sinensis]|uniref:Uncharacterized protein n=1 Tax=Anopheles sinensis TaxID=74873 RepID=A0A084VAD4_ANOSI|nr:hypothetical protein ZHAS_00000614 [Anopheles sinensis]
MVQKSPETACSSCAIEEEEPRTEVVDEGAEEGKNYNSIRGTKSEHTNSGD